MGQEKGRRVREIEIIGENGVEADILEGRRSGEDLVELGDGGGELGAEAAQGEVGEGAERVPADGDKVEREAAEGREGRLEDKGGGGGGDPEGEGVEDGEIAAEVGEELEHVVGEEEDVDGGEARGVGAKVFGGDLEGGGGVDGDGGGAGAEEELAGEAAVGEVDALPETRRVEGDGAPLAADLGPREAVSGLGGAVEPGDAEAEDVLEDLGGEDGDGGELVEHRAHRRELGGQALLLGLEEGSAIHGWCAIGCRLICVHQRRAALT